MFRLQADYPARTQGAKFHFQSIKKTKMYKNVIWNLKVEIWTIAEKLKDKRKENGFEKKSNIFSKKRTLVKFKKEKVLNMKKGF